MYRLWNETQKLVVQDTVGEPMLATSHRLQERNVPRVFEQL